MYAWKLLRIFVINDISSVWHGWMCVEWKETQCFREYTIHGCQFVMNLCGCVKHQQIDNHTKREKTRNYTKKNLLNERLLRSHEIAMTSCFVRIDLITSNSISITHNISPYWLILTSDCLVIILLQSVAHNNRTLLHFSICIYRPCDLMRGKKCTITCTIQRNLREKLTNEEMNAEQKKTRSNHNVELKKTACMLHDDDNFFPFCILCRLVGKQQTTCWAAHKLPFLNRDILKWA